MWALAKHRVSEILVAFISELLLINALVFLMQAIRSKHQTWVIASAVELNANVMAFFGGVIFVTTQADMFSLVMVYGFLVAFAAYGWGLFAARK